MNQNLYTNGSIAGELDFLHSCTILNNANLNIKKFLDLELYRNNF